jgi:hypothetical protein
MLVVGTRESAHQKGDVKINEDCESSRLEKFNNTECGRTADNLGVWRNRDFDPRMILSPLHSAEGRRYAGFHVE